MGGSAVRHVQFPIFQRIGKVLHDQLDDVVREPLPDRWVDLIHFLNAKERGEHDAGRHTKDSTH